MFPASSFFFKVQSKIGVCIIHWHTLRPVQTLATLLANKTQHCFAQHVASVCTPCCVLLSVVGSSWMKFETGQTSEPTSANISIVSRSSKRGPTMFRSFAKHIQQCCAGARALHATYPLYSHLKTQQCCVLLRAFARAFIYGEIR